MSFYRYRSIKDIPSEHRPREKLKRLGAKELSDEELLAVVFGSGTKGVDVMALARSILKKGWNRLRDMELSELKALKGMGEVKALQIKALIELSERIGRPITPREILSPKDAYALLKDIFRDDKEMLVALYLDLSHRLLGTEVVAVGSLNRVYASPKDVLKPALKLSAYGIIVSHNHPQGNFKPSEEDISFTDRLRKSCEILGFELLDHIVVSPEGFLSFKEESLL